jgi:threonine aldolase
VRTFRSDNNAGVCPEALQAIAAAAQGHQPGYGDDDDTNAAAAAFHNLFNFDTRVFFVATGTAANTLAIASLTRPWMRILCYDQAHLNDDESTAPERITQCRVAAITPRSPERSSKIEPDQVAEAGETTRGVHQPQPGVLTISNPTEFAEVYTPAEVRALCAAAHDAGFTVHVDGARFANAVARTQQRTGDDPAAIARALTVDAGVDALSFGGTKNGLAYGEAVLFFPQGDGARCEQAARDFPYHRKATGHLLSKHRFVSAQFAATLESGAWLTHAAHANAMADRLAHALRELGVEIPFSVDANAVFAKIPGPMEQHLRARGHAWYPFGPTRWGLSRLMCSFDTNPEDIDAFIADAKEAM